MDEHKRNEMDKMDDMFDTQFYDLSVESRPYPVLCTMQESGCTAFAPDFPSLQIQAPTLDAALMAAKKKIQKALKQFKNPPIPTNQDQIVTPPNCILILLKAS